MTDAEQGEAARQFANKWQKGSSHPLDKKEPQSGGELLTPYEQEKRHNDNLPFDEKARWIVTSNFISIWVMT